MLEDVLLKQVVKVHYGAGAAGSFLPFPASLHFWLRDDITFTLASPIGENFLSTHSACTKRMY